MSATAVAETFGSLLPSDADNLYEIVNGERRELEPMGAYEVWVACVAMARMANYAIDQRLGKVVTEMLFILDRERNTQRRPDLAFISRARCEAAPMRPGINAWNVVPNLAAEVVSPTNTAAEIDEKLVDYFTAGVQVAWVIYPVTRRVYVYRSLTECRVLQGADELDTAGLLPGFQLTVDALFAIVDDSLEEAAN